MPEPFVEYVGATEEGKLEVRWLTPAYDTRACLIAIATTSDMSENRRVFVLPIENAGHAVLSVGNGGWYVRVGAAHGAPEQGVISWSAGTYGPVAIVGSTNTTPAPSTLPTPPTHSLPVLHSSPVDGGYRIHTGKAEPHVVVFEVGTVADVGVQFPMTKTAWKWVAEKGGGSGWTDCWGLNYPETYAIRMSTFAAPTWPTDNVALLVPVRTFPRVVCARTPFHRDFAEKQNARGDALLLQQRKVTPNMKFSSHSEYLRYQAAVVRSGDDKARTVGPAHFSALEEGRL